MATFYDPALMGSRRFKAYLNQQSATSGAVPSAGILENIIKEELGAINDRQYQRKLDEYRQKQQELAIRNAQWNLADTAYNTSLNRDILKAKRAQGIGGALTTLGTTALSLYGGR